MSSGTDNIQPGSTFEPRTLELPKLNLPPLPRFSSLISEPFKLDDRPAPLFARPVGLDKPVETDAPVAVEIMQTVPKPGSALTVRPKSESPVVYAPPVKIDFPKPSTSKTWTPRVSFAQPVQVEDREMPALHIAAFVMTFFSMIAMSYIGYKYGSVALFSCAALFAADLAVANTVRTAPGSARSRLTTVLAAISIGLIAWAGIQLPGQFSDMAFVAGLFVALVSLPVLILNAISSYVICRRSDRMADQAFRSGAVVRSIVMFFTLLAGYKAFDSFSTMPDTMVAVPVALIALATVATAWRNRSMV